RLTEQLLTARSCTCTARRATSCGAALMGSGGTSSTTIKARRYDTPPDVCAPRLSAMEPLFGMPSTITAIPSRRSRPADPMHEYTRIVEPSTVPAGRRHRLAGHDRLAALTSVAGALGDRFGQKRIDATA